MITPIEYGDIHKLSRKDIEAIPFIGWDEDVPEFDSFAILPSRKRHDSGYRVMSYALLKRGMIVGKINQGSDHLQLYDISSLLKSHKVPGYENAKDGVMWDVDCIAKNGLLRFYSINGGPTFQLEAGVRVSSQTIF